ncbi:MAG: hypothetical protein J7J72_07965 [Bacteroidales bacterium]|nr:hypothetical protein [Bacteroidales bacterium]
MPRVFKIISLLFIAFSFSSCIELVEEIKINPDLSGEYHLYLENKGLDFLFDGFSQNINQREIEYILGKLKHQKGISNLTADTRINKGKFSISFNFSNAKSLTNALYASFGVKKQFYHKAFLKVNHRKIKRPNLSPYLIKYAENQGLMKQLPSEKMLDYIDYRYKIISSKPIKSALPPANIQSLNQLEYSQLYSSKSLLLNKQSTKSVLWLKRKTK